MRILAALILLTVAVAAPSANLWVVEHGKLDHQVWAMRTHHGLPALVESQALSSLATEQSYAMARAGVLFHHIPPEAFGTFVEVGQNVGRGGQVWQVVAAMMDSPYHRDILLGDWVEVGFGHVREDGQVWVTLLFR